MVSFFTVSVVLFFLTCGLLPLLGLAAVDLVAAGLVTVDLVVVAGFLVMALVRPF